MIGLLKKFLPIILILLLIFLSITPRSVEVINGNFLFLLDQGRDYIAVKSIVSDHKLTLIGAEIGYGFAGLQGVFHGPFYFYFLSIPFILFNGDPYGGLLLMFAFGILTIVLSFFFAKRVLGTMGAIVMALLVSISPSLISQSRFIWSPHPSSFLIVAAFYFIYLSHKRKGLPIFLAAFFSGFLYNFEIAIAAPFCMTLVLYMIFVVKLRQIKQYVFLVGGFVTALLTFIFFELRHSFQAVKGVISYFLTSGHNVSLRSNPLRLFEYTFFDSFPRQSLFPLSLLILIFISAVLLFLVKEKRRDIKYFLLFLILLIATTFIAFLFVRTHIFEYYLIHINFVFIFIFSYLLISSYNKKELHFKILFTGFFVVFLIYGTLSGINTFKRDLSDYGGMVKIKGKIDALDYIYTDAKEERFGLLIFSPPIYTYPYDYLIWWYGQRRYGYLPHQEKRGIFYLLIERDSSQPWTYKGWLETVIKSGTIIKEIELPSGFIIQKRLGEQV